MESVFEIQKRIQATVGQFLESVASGTRSGWGIGVLPQERQILRMLQSLHFDEKPLHLPASAQCPGEGEKEPLAVRENPFVIGIDGTHRTYVPLPGGKGDRR